MFKRRILKNIKEWSMRDRKPLIIHGARQVGKTYVVKLAAEYFEEHIFIDLEKSEDLNYFSENITFKDFIQLIQLKFKKKIKPGKTLLFIDEIQNSEKAIKFLRFFYEEYPDLHIIAAGSLLDVKIKKSGFSFPVGRTEHLYLYPVTFIEFLEASGNNEMLEKITESDFEYFQNETIHKLYMDLFNKFSLIGGMPEIIKKYINNNDLTLLHPVYESLITGYNEDIHKYSSQIKSKYIEHCLKNAPYHISQRIKYNGFGNSAYKSREIEDAISILESAMLVKRVYPCVETKPPLQPDMKKSPKLFYMDAGLVNYVLNIQVDFIGADDLNNIYSGAIAEQMTVQELTGLVNNRNNDLMFWVRNKPGATAELDLVYQYKKMIIPIEIKSGETGKLKSLHLFMSKVKHQIAVRIYSGVLKIDEIKNKDVKYTLISLPFYLISKLEIILEKVLNRQ